MHIIKSEVGSFYQNNIRIALQLIKICPAIFYSIIYEAGIEVVMRLLAYHTVLQRLELAFT